ncbi:MAG: ATP-binding protein [Pseudomonadaceae bacterium]|nr:ATP-binding protein [Pseudomonadaceae bacterium]
MTWADRYIPQKLREDAEQRRRAGVIIYATTFGCLSSLMIFVSMFVLEGDGGAWLGLVWMLPIALTYPIMCMSGSNNVAGHYFLSAILVGAVLACWLHGPHFVVAYLGMPMAAAHVLGARSALLWSVVAAAFALLTQSFFPLSLPSITSFNYAVVAMILVVGLAAIVVEYMRNQAVVQAAAAVEELEKERSRMRTVVESLTPGLIDLEEGRITYIAPGVRELSGHEPEEVIGQDILNFVHPDDISRSLTWLETAMPGDHVELRLRHKDGHWVWLRVHLIPIDGDDQDHRLRLAGYDVSAERDSRAQQMRAQRLQGVGVLAAGVAHDFNNLLTVITGFAELMPASEAQENILKASDEAAQLVQKLMAFGKSSPVEGGGADIDKILNASEPVLRSLLTSVGKLHVNSKVADLRVPISASQINQILLNLVTNAKEALGADGNVWIDLEVLNLDLPRGELAAGAYAQLTIVDDGGGMEAYTREHAFDPFYTTKADRSGTGLGLASVYGLVRHAGGEVEVSSEPGKGTAVTLILPLQETEGAIAASADDLNFTIGQGRILIVEDDELIADLIARSLVHAGYSVTIKHDVESAWRQLRADVPDLLITDIMMPDGRGTDLAKRWYEDEQSEVLPMLFISGYSDQEIGDWKDATGPVKFLAKPFRTKELLERVGQLINQPSSDLTHSRLSNRS